MSNFNFILPQFRDMLRQLADKRDCQGQKKLDPKSVIFVANIWDTVTADEKQVYAFQALFPDLQMHTKYILECCIKTTLAHRCLLVQ